MILRVQSIFILCLSTALGLFHLYASGIQLFPAVQQRGVHLGIGLALIFLLYPVIKKKTEEHTQNNWEIIISFILAFLSLYIGYYFFMNYRELYSLFGSLGVELTIVGLLTLLLTLEATRRIIGWTLPILAAVFLLFAFFGDHLPLLFAHSGFSFEQILANVSLTAGGILGVPLGVSATYVVLFVLFGAFLEKSGAGQLFIDLSFALVGKFRGGATKVSILASALFGTISGSQVANVSSTGVLTIPLMKRSGYSSRYAGAVESVASTGGMFLPPVMGAVAFLIADFLQVPYVQVILAAIIPAVLYFIAVFIMADLRAARIGASYQKDDYEIPNLKYLFVQKGHLLLPLLLLIYLLIVEQMNPPKAAFWSIIAMPLASWLRKETRMSPADIVECIKSGVKLSLIVIAACASAGIIIGIINMTGLGLRFSSILIELSGENLFPLLILTMIASIIMGMGLPPVASYIILATLAAPAITQLGVPDLAAHLFIFYYGTLSAITPPVAIAAYAASGIAKSNPMSTSFTAVKLASVAFIVPFMFVYGPALIFDGSWFNILGSFVTALVGIFALSVGMEGHLKNKIEFLSRSLFLIGALLLMIVGWGTDFIGFIIIAAVFFREWKKQQDAARTNAVLHDAK
ncbi:TRAP transporter, 4TM/12TM fusion protein [Alteribacillus persepolensis]|uniref:TRAP transporter, 4TM/12TM fusion protein n=1 Tax=Alteribacillus persepolensis TaxID=568899 RepID=A0A1G8A710_9BACI|nr:TRAP transporter permease [Alteribacillus persepolensis]SDH16719.1 TRAP transporter, 4TM/12TM fusion protein [Alteribacillus persepolensis]